MSVSQDVFSLINALPEAVLVIERKGGKFAGANAAFSELMGLNNDAFIGVQIFDLPFSTKQIKRGMLRLFVEVSRYSGRDKVYSFSHVCPNGIIKNISASARKAVLDEREHVIFELKADRSEDSLLENSDSWKYYMKLACEPYIEFRPVVPISFATYPYDRLEFLQMLGGTLRVKFFNSAAAEFYYGNKGNNGNRELLEGRTFLSFFTKENDAIGFLDMLSAVGHIRGVTDVNTYRALGVHVEMNCMIKFSDEGDIMGLYCAQRDLSELDRYKAISGYSRAEMDFMFNQPFIGFAFLTPPKPLERPTTENLDAKLDEMLNQIKVARANETIVDIYGLDKSKFIMKSMQAFFHDEKMARQALKELFIMRETSAERHYAPGGDFKLSSIFRAVFDNADRLSGVFVVTSKHDYERRR